MLGLEGYGSDSDGASDDAPASPPRGRVTLLARDDPPPPSPAPAASPPRARAPLNFAAALPEPTASSAPRGGMFAALPGPAEGKRVVVRLEPPADLAPDSDSDSDPSDPADPAAKRRATAPASAKISLAASLPQPKNAGGFGRGQGGGAALDLGGGDRGGGTALDLGADRAIAAAEPEPAAGPSLHPSQLYAVDADTGAYAHAASGDPYVYARASADARRPERPGSIPRGPDVEAAFAYVRGGGARGPGGGEAPKVREMNLDALRAEASRGRADGVAGATAGATGLAFGDEFREKLAREAGAKPSAAHRSKNQIGSLLYNAKQAEMQIMEGRLAGVSHKAAAKRKYGW